MTTNTILYGNGFNQLSKGCLNWNDLLDRISKGNVIDNIPNTMKYEAIILSQKRMWSRILLEHGAATLTAEDRESVIKEGIRDQLARYESNEFYKLLAEIPVNHYLTPNYDYAFKSELLKQNFTIISEESSERLYSIRRHCTFLQPDKKGSRNIWYIHGEINRPYSIMLGMDHYCGSIGKIDDFLKGNYTYGKERIQLPNIISRLRNDEADISLSWIDAFFTSNVHIIGFGLGFEEIDLWWILTRRKRYIRIHGNKLISNKIYFYDKEIDSHKRKLLEALDVEVYVTEEEDYPLSYKKMLNEIKLNISK